MSEELKSQVCLLEKKYSHVQRHLERNDNVSLVSRVDAKAGESEKEKMNLLEKRIGKKVAETVD
jgi:hypothetical protein